MISVACEDPEKSNRPVTSWTAKEIASEAVLRGIVSFVSVSPRQRFLHKVQLQPHQKKGWCFTTEKDQELFQSQAEAVSHAYLDAPKLLQEKNIRTVSIDEMTSLQANEKRAAGRRPSPGQCGKEECQYTRHGTARLTENWDVVAGQFIMPTIEQTRNNEDFAKHVERLMNSGLADGWVIVVDNLNTHCGEPLVRMIAKHLGISSDQLGQVGKFGILKNMAGRRAFLSDLSHQVRFVYVAATLPRSTSLGDNRKNGRNLRFLAQAAGRSPDTAGNTGWRLAPCRSQEHDSINSPPRRQER